MYDSRDDEDEESLDADNVEETRIKDNLPTLHENERADTAVERMRDTLNALDGSPMAVSNALVPLEAHDVGDVSIDPNPRSAALADSDIDCDNGYVEYGGCVVETDEKSGRVIMSDPPNWALAGETHMSADEGTFIEDITEWA
jgi:hypothetical protein